MEPDQNFCKGASILLNAGSGFSSFTWNSVSGTQTKAVNLAKQNAIVEIKTILSLPGGIHLVDASVSSYGTLLLYALQPYSSYIWINVGTASTTNINKLESIDSKRKT